MNTQLERLGRCEATVRESFVETFSRMMGAEVRPRSEEATPLEAELTAVVGFTGDATGYLALHVKREAMRACCAALLGLEPEEDEEDDDELFEETLGELTYMVMSRALPRLLAEGVALTLWLPSIVAGARIDPEESSSRLRAVAYYERSGDPIDLQLVLLDEQEAAVVHSGHETSPPGSPGRSARLLTRPERARPVGPVLSRELVLEALEDVKRLPALPEAALALQQELARGGRVRVARIQEIVEGDAAIAAMALKVANSVYYRGVVACNSVADAVVRLGLDETRRIALTACVLGNLDRLPDDEHVRTWARAVHVGSTCEVLTTMTPGTHDLGGPAYTCGLLHEIGAIALRLLWPSAYENMLAASRERGEPAAATQLRRWGIDYAEVGGEVARRWQLPDSISEVIRYQRTPLVAPAEHRRLAQLVQLSASICHLVEAGHELESDAGQPLAGLWEALGLGPEDARSVFARALELRRVAEAMVKALAA